jgi:2-methylisocitrate lyase-like PEP mutase family enzyme
MTKTFHDLHMQSSPLILFNAWDAATAKAAQNAGSKAIATGSWSVAAAQGYADGQNISLDFVTKIVERIVKSVDVPVSVDFECGYADDLSHLATNFKQIIDTGAVGVNFEDQLIGVPGLQSPINQARRLETLANTASQSGVKMFLNARTDLFLQEKDTSLHPRLLKEAVQRAAAYVEAGATGFFVPGLTDEKLIQDLCKEVSLPVNIMAGSVKVDAAKLRQLGVSRISFGPHPFFDHIAAFEFAAANATISN